MIVAELSGGPFERGHQQGAVAPHLHDHVRRWIERRIDRADAALRDVRARQVARDLAAFAEHHCSEAIAEARGIAQVFALSPDDVLKSWQVAAYAQAGGGCSLVAWSDGRNALLAKTRDVPADTLPIQSVFRQRSADFQAGAILSLSTLGSAAAASSGVNAAGLALADAAVPTRDHGSGILRYLLMQRLLDRCRTVREAIDEIRDTPHAGGGSLLLADAEGAIAAVEIGHRKLGIELKSQGVIARTNHHLDAALGPARAEAAGSEGGQSSRKRLARIEAAMAGAESVPSPETLASLMSMHGEGALCRHATPSSDIATISLAILDPARRALAVSDGPPCCSPVSSLQL
jgi:isopenicillin-N N-acyltransferase like protein